MTAPASVRLAACFAIALIETTSSSLVRAAGPPDHLRGRPELEVADTRAGEARAQPRISSATSRASAARHWSRFLAVEGGAWRVRWDADTAVPRYLFGTGISAPGSVASADIAELFALQALERHLPLLSPGAAADDFVLVANDLDAGMRTVALLQYHQGARVLGGQVSFRFKNDRLFVIASRAWPNVGVRMPAERVGANQARSTAARWIDDDFDTAAAAGDPGVLSILPILRSSGAIEYRAVAAVRVDSQRPVGAWQVYLDAHTGARVARQQLLRFAAGRILYNAPERYPLSTRADYPASGVGLTIADTTVETDDAGEFSWAGSAPASVTLRAQGPLVRVLSDAGADITETVTVDPDGSFAWNHGDTEYSDAQIASYTHSQIVKAWARNVTGGMDYLDQQLQVTVNIADTCNAYSDGTTINFFRSGGGCGNTARIADIVYHEFGHSFHYHAIIQGAGAWDGALSEGSSDYTAATIVNDPAMGRGFFNNDEPLRHIDEAEEATWPEDIGEVHTTGIIIGGTLWDLRKNLIAMEGEAEGVALSDWLFYQGLRRAPDIPGMYVEVLAADDDDGNLDNGTPHSCAINEAFARHGLGDPDAPLAPALQRPERTGWQVLARSLSAAGCPESDPVASATLTWQLRATPSVGGSVAMVEGAEGYGADIPEQGFGEVVQYLVHAELASGSVLEYPSNPAAPMYEFFVGEVSSIYCTDFEGASAPDGWVHGLESGEVTDGADDWQWGAPQGVPDSGDPRAAFSGANVYGNDLGGADFNGTYQSDKVNYLETPPVAIGADYDVVRLQYRRWLSIEDGVHDQASILANGTEVWSNLVDDGQTHHQDREWRFHDVDISAAVQSGEVVLRFELASNGANEFGGWNIDDVCVVAYVIPECGNGDVEGDEECDDGNDVDTDACRSDCTAFLPDCGNSVVDDGEQCDDGNREDGDGCSATCVSEIAGGLDEGLIYGSCGCGSGNRAPGGGTTLTLILLAAASASSRRRTRRRAS